MTSKREDSFARYKAIKSSYGDFYNKSLLDVGCAEGYFLFKFLMDGGIKALGVEIDESKREFVNKLAMEKHLNAHCLPTLSTDAEFDIAIYLDLYGHSEESFKLLDQIHSQCETLFVSRSGVTGDGRDEKLTSHLTQLGRKWTNVTTAGFNGRIILRADR